MTYQLSINPVSAKKQRTKFASAKFRKVFRPSYIILKIQRLAINIDLEEVAHYQPLHQNLYCKQIYIFLSLVPSKVLTL